MDSPSVRQTGQDALGRGFCAPHRAGAGPADKAALAPTSGPAKQPSRNFGTHGQRLAYARSSLSPHDRLQDKTASTPRTQRHAETPKEQGRQSVYSVPLRCLDVLLVGFRGNPSPLRGRPVRIGGGVNVTSPFAARVRGAKLVVDFELTNWTGSSANKGGQGVLSWPMCTFGRLAQADCDDYCEALNGALPSELRRL